jgi:hypothetical protein
MKNKRNISTLKGNFEALLMISGTFASSYAYRPTLRLMRVPCLMIAYPIPDEYAST